MNKIKIEDAVFCEDARQEMSGKYTLLGVGGSELNISEIPAFISIAILIYGTAFMEGQFEAEMRALDVDKNILVKADLEGKIDRSKRFILLLGPMPLQIKKAGNYTFEWRSGTKKWNKIATLRLNYLPPSDAIKNASPSA